MSQSNPSTISALKFMIPGAFVFTLGIGFAVYGYTILSHRPHVSDPAAGFTTRFVMKQGVYYVSHGDVVTLTGMFVVFALAVGACFLWQLRLAKKLREAQGR